MFFFPGEYALCGLISQINRGFVLNALIIYYKIYLILVFPLRVRSRGVYEHVSISIFQLLYIFCYEIKRPRSIFRGFSATPFCLPHYDPLMSRVPGDAWHVALFNFI